MLCLLLVDKKGLLSLRNCAGRGLIPTCHLITPSDDDDDDDDPPKYANTAFICARRKIAHFLTHTHSSGDMTLCRAGKVFYRARYLYTVVPSREAVEGVKVQM